jgi:dTDP-4-amino-4,6-dideoxygalactose transaminase
MIIPMSAPDLTEAERQAVQRVLETPFLSLGPRLTEFEERFASTFGVHHAVGVSSGTAALHLCVIAAGVKEGDLVLTTPFSFIASANCILYERGIPVFVDVDPVTGNMDPTKVAEALHDLSRGGAAARRWLPPARAQVSPGQFSNQPVKAILPVHAFGQPVDMEPLQEAALRYDLWIIEDACEALGSEYKGRKVGTLGDMAAFAFYPNKQITTGEGGMIVSNHADLEPLWRSLRNQGRDVFDAWLNHSRLGYNYRLDELSAALGIIQLQRLEELLGKRARVARWYNERLSGLELIERPGIIPPTTRMSWFVYVIRVKSPLNRDKLMQRLEAAGIPSRPYFTPIHLQPYYQAQFGYSRGDFPVTEYLGEVSLALPFSGLMNEAQVDYVCDHLRQFVQQGEVGA